MKRGFTLLELLIVIVIVGTLVTIALPKYQNALERGRALEGVRNVQYIAEYVGAKHMATGDWPTEDEMKRLQGTDIVKSRFFGDPKFNSESKKVSISRKGDWTYSLSATLGEDDAVKNIKCSGKDCKTLDLNVSNLMER